MPEHIKLSEANDAVALAKLATQALLEAKNSKTSASGSKFISDGQEDENGIPLGTGTILNGVSGGVQQWVNDTTAPGTPTGLSISSSSGSVFITWTGTLDGGVPPDFDHITVNATDGDRQFVAGSMSNSGTIAIADLTAGDTVTVTAVAYDDAHDEDGNSRPNVSQPSAPISVKVVSSVDQSVIDKINADLADNKKILDQASKDIAANKTSIDQTGKDLDQAKTDLSAAKNDLTHVTTNLISVGNDVETLKPDVAQAKQDISKAKTDIGNVTVTVTTISNDVSNAKNDIAATNNKVTQVQQTANNALTTANNAKNITWSVDTPTSNTPAKVGDLWYQVNSTGTDIISFWRYGTPAGSVGQWVSAPIADSVIANLDAGKINTGTLAAGRIAAGSITGDKIAANSITAGHIVANSITSDKLVANAVTAGKIAANAIGADNIVSNAITSAKLAANSVNANNIVAGAITGDKIAANSITAAKIAANTITSDKINVGSIAAALVSSGKFTTSDGNVGFDNSGFWIKDPSGGYRFIASPTGVQVAGSFSTAMSGDHVEVKQRKFGGTLTGGLYGVPGNWQPGTNTNPETWGVWGATNSKGDVDMYLGTLMQQSQIMVSQNADGSGFTSILGGKSSIRLGDSLELTSNSASENLNGYIQLNSGPGHAIWLNNNSGMDTRIGTAAHPSDIYINDMDYMANSRERFAYYNNWHGNYSENSHNGKYVQEYSASVNILGTGWYRVEIGQACNGEAILLFSLQTSTGAHVIDIPVNGVNGPSTNNKVTNSKTVHINKGTYIGRVYYTWWGNSASITGSGNTGTQFRDQQHGLYSRYCSLIAD